MTISKSLSPLFILLAFLLSAALAGCGGNTHRYQRPAPRGAGHPGVVSTGSAQGRVSAPPSQGAPSAEASGDCDSDDGSAYEPQSRPGESIARERRERPGLGTRFGEQRQSVVSKKRFERASNSPFARVALHYNNFAGIRAQSWFRGTSLRELRAQTRAGGISISLIDESGRLLQGGTGAGRTYVVGRDGQRYSLQIRNDTGGSYEMVASVDGLDIVDGEPANFTKRGYILAPYSTLVVEGFRTSQHAVAAFRFGAVSDSYAARTSGDRNVGVIGFAFFAERGSRWTTDEIRRRETANPFPGEYARPPMVVR